GMKSSHHERVRALCIVIAQTYSGGSLVRKSPPRFLHLKPIAIAASLLRLALIPARDGDWRTTAATRMGVFSSLTTIDLTRLTAKTNARSIRRRRRCEAVASSTTVVDGAEVALPQQPLAQPRRSRAALGGMLTAQCPQDGLC